MNIESLKTFLVLAEVRNFRKAAQQLFIVPSTVSTRINELEKELGQQLFDRSGRLLQLTSAGQKMIYYALEMVRLEEKMYQCMDSSSCHIEILRIAACSSIFEQYVFPRIPSFVEKYPDIYLDIYNRYSPDVQDMLLNDEADIGISFLPCSEKEYENILLAEGKIMLVTHRKNDPYPEGVTLEDLAHMPLYMSDYFMLTKELTDWYQKVFKKSFRFVLRLPDIMKMRELLCCGRGYAFLPEAFIRQELEDGELVEIPLKFTAPPDMGIYIAVEKKRLTVQKISCFIRELQTGQRMEMKKSEQGD